jgi:RNA 2',3'-cyclic 3'-phosphodiesterase
MTRDEREPSSRLFTAIPLDPATREHVASISRVASERVEGARWVPAENLHITLRFIGDCPDATVPVLLKSIEKAVRHLPADVVVGGLGGFPSSGSARVIWVGVDDPTGALTKVYNVLDKSASRCGFGRESRKYRPHITIGRSKRPASIPERLVAESASERVPMVAKSVVLYKSELRRAGADYTEIVSIGPPSAVE